MCFELNTIYFIPKKFKVAEKKVAQRNAIINDRCNKFKKLSIISFVITFTKSVEIYNNMNKKN